MLSASPTPCCAPRSWSARRRDPVSPLAVVLPGRAYPVTMPALTLVADLLGQHGHEVRSVAWTLSEPPADPADFVVRRLLEAAPQGCDLVVGKSLGCWASSYAAAAGCAAIWLTPVLVDVEVVAGIRANRAPQLVIAGLADPLHVTAVAAGLAGEVLELPGVDHALSSTGDGVVGADILDRIAVAVEDFLRRLA